MTKLNITITASDDNNLILETRGRVSQAKVIPRNKDAATALYSAIEDAFKANERPERAQPAVPATPAKLEK